MRHSGKSFDTNDEAISKSLDISNAAGVLKNVTCLRGSDWDFTVEATWEAMTSLHYSKVVNIYSRS